MSNQTLFGGIRIDPATGQAVSNKDKPGSLAPATGSLPVSSDAFLELAARWEYAASLCKRGDFFSVEQAGKRMLLACASDLRRQVALSTERQLEECEAAKTPASDDPHAAAVFNLHRRRQGLG